MREKSSISTIVDAGFLIFAFALLIRLWFVFSDGHQAHMNALDASEYVRNGRAVQNFVSDKSSSFWLNSISEGLHLLPEKVSIEIRSEYGSLQELVTRSGPIYPGFIALGLAMGHPFFGEDSLYGPVILQCLLGALTCLLIAFSTYRLFDSQAGLYSGILAALYPGFIVNTVRLISESFATFWAALVIALVVALLTNSRQKPLLAFALGVSLAVLQLTRSALILVSIVTLIMGLLLIKKKLVPTSLAMLVAGMGFVLASFVSLQALIVGSGSLLIDRLSHYNLFIGLNLESLGWLAYPLPNLALIQDNSYFEIIKMQFLQSPIRFLSLLLDKMPRLFAWPFNDFRASIGSINCGVQIVVHQVYLILALVGAAFVLFYPPGSDEEKTQSRGLTVAKVYLVVFWAVHLVYILFVSMARYVLTALPVIVIFSGIGFAILVRKLSDSKGEGRMKGLLFLLSGTLMILFADLDWNGVVFGLWGFEHFNRVLIFAVLVKLVALGLCLLSVLRLGPFSRRLCLACFGVTFLILAPFVAFPLCAYGPAAEWKAPLDDRWPESLQKIQVKETTGQNYLLVDCPDWTTLGQSARVFINEQEIASTAMPLLPLNGINGLPKLRTGSNVYCEFDDILNSMFDAVGGSVMNMRQWFLLPIPSGLLDFDQEIKNELQIRIAVKPGHKTQLFGRYVTRRGQIGLPGLFMHSWDKLFYGIENKSGLSDARYATKVSLSDLGDRTKDLSSEFGMQTGELGVRFLNTNSEILNGGTDNTKEAVVDLGGARDGFTRIFEIASLPSKNLDLDSFWLISVKGEFYSDSGQSYKMPVDMSMQVMTGKQTGAAKRVYHSPWMPTSLVVLPGENTFCFTVPLKPSGFPGVPETIVLSVQPGGRAKSSELFGVGENHRGIKNISWKRLSISLLQLDQVIDVSKSKIY